MATSTNWTPFFVATLKNYCVEKEIPNFQKLIIIPHLCHVHPRAGITKTSISFMKNFCFLRGIYSRENPF
jgi:hypothetical protein